VRRSLKPPIRLPLRSTSLRPPTPRPPWAGRHHRAACTVAPESVAMRTSGARSERTEQPAPRPVEPAASCARRCRRVGRLMDGCGAAGVDGNCAGRSRSGRARGFATVGRLAHPVSIRWYCTRHASLVKNPACRDVKIDRDLLCVVVRCCPCRPIPPDYAQLRSISPCGTLLILLCTLNGLVSPKGAT